MVKETIQDGGNQQLESKTGRVADLINSALKRTTMVYWKNFKRYGCPNLLEHLKAVLEHFQSI